MLVQCVLCAVCPVAWCGFDWEGVGMWFVVLRERFQYANFLFCYYHHYYHFLHHSLFFQFIVPSRSVCLSVFVSHFLFTYDFRVLIFHVIVIILFTIFYYLYSLILLFSLVHFLSLPLCLVRYVSFLHFFFYSSLWSTFSLVPVTDLVVVRLVVRWWCRWS